jgi:hypothetical protein
MHYSSTEEHVYIQNTDSNKKQPLQKGKGIYCAMCNPLSFIVYAYLLIYNLGLGVHVSNKTLFALICHIWAWFGDVLVQFYPMVDACEMGRGAHLILHFLYSFFSLCMPYLDTISTLNAPLMWSICWLGDIKEREAQRVAKPLLTIKHVLPSIGWRSEESGKEFEKMSLRRRMPISKIWRVWYVGSR